MTARKLDPRRERWERPETLHDAIEGTIFAGAHGVPAKVIGEELHLPEGAVYELPSPVGGRPLKASQLVPLMAVTGDDRILHYLAERRGYLLVRMPPATLDDASTLRLSCEALRECVEAVEHYGAAMADGHMTEGEALDVARECDEGAAALMRIKSAAAARRSHDEPR